jgi:hypothetical protein
MGKRLPPFSAPIEEERRRWMPFKKALPKTAQPFSTGSSTAPRSTCRPGFASLVPGRLNRLLWLLSWSSGSRGMFGIPVQTGHHREVGCDCARTRFTMSPTAEQLTWPAQASRICRTLMPVVPANASIRDTRCAGVAGHPSYFPRARTAPILRGGSGNPAAVVSIHALAVVSIHAAQRAHFVQIIGAK